MNWMEFTIADDDKILVNLSNLHAVRQNSRIRTDLIFVGGFTYEVHGSYEEVIARMKQTAEALGLYTEIRKRD